MKLSIITINYNNISGLENTINSILKQKWRGFEWIIIDGGSTDGSKELIMRTAKNYESQISFWCSEPDKGIYNAMNKGIAHAKGDYLSFMNSGDYYYNDSTLEKIFGESHNEDILTGDVINETSRKLLRDYDRHWSLVEIGINKAFYHQGSFIKRTLQEQNLYDESLKIASDWKFFLKAIVKDGCRVKYLNDIVATVQDGGISFTQQEQQWKERQIILKEVLGERVVREIWDYYLLRSYDIVNNSEYLHKKHKKLYVLVRRIISLITRFAKMFD